MWGRGETIEAVPVINNMQGKHLTLMWEGPQMEFIIGIISQICFFKCFIYKNCFLEKIDDFQL